MSNVIEMNEFCGMSNGDIRCWLCQKPVSMRALFCHICGTIQPVRDIDYFARLGIDRSLDVNVEVLERQYVALARTLSPDRFLIRGMGERGHAAKQLEALREAYDTLRDPLRRGRYWLDINDKNPKGVHANDEDEDPVVGDLRRELTAALEPGHCDRVAQKAGHALEQGVVALMQSLRGGNWHQANLALAKIDSVEGIMDEARAMREGFAAETAQI